MWQRLYKLQLRVALFIAVVEILMIIRIVFVDSPKRWPDVGWFDRLARVMTFYDPASRR